MTRPESLPLKARLLQCGCPDCVEAVQQIDLQLAALKKLVRALEQYEDIPVRCRGDEGWLLDTLGHEVGSAYLDARAAIAKATPLSSAAQVPGD